ncbi:NAD(P)/FAD-dependent oxidoreductase [Streptomyces sp. NBC_01244]|uniref:NAD(P)/FAD-dependent oxidoreductase n=1 Tax=Streptomyces sp. NBC_01244 TaxID=2903797 RepID=UPI002E12202A|nr:FAD-dependent oxidoreductase [Streptomyces sp. NBC_01244]
MTRNLVVVGHGMVGHHLVAEVRARDRGGAWRITVHGEEGRPAYDRVALSSYAHGRVAAALTLPREPLEGADVRLGSTVTAVDPARRTVRCADGREVPYDALVLATGSRPFVPPVPGHDLPGCHVYRTIEDVDAIRAAARPGRPAVVIGGGLLGLEAASALHALGMRTEVVERAPWLMALQVDAGGGAVLGRRISALGIGVHCDAAVESVDPGADGAVAAVTLAGTGPLPADLVVFAAGVRPRDELAAAAGLARAERGGILTDRHCRTSDPAVWAVGECAAVEGRCHGMVAPGRRMAEAVAAQLTGDPAAAFPGADPAARLKLLGVEVAGFGDVQGREPGALEFVRHDHRTDAYAKLTLAADARTVLGAVLSGDTRAYPALHALYGRPLTASADRLMHTPG